MAYQDRYKQRQVGLEWTYVVCVHPAHGVEEFWIPNDHFPTVFIGLIGMLWANGYTITINACGA